MRDRRLLLLSVMSLALAACGGGSSSSYSGSSGTTASSSSSGSSSSSSSSRSSSSSSSSSSGSSGASSSGSSGGSQAALAITTSSCPAGTQGTSYAGCTIVATGGVPPYAFTVSSSSNYPPLPEGMSLNASSGLISSTFIGGQGTYGPQITVTDSAHASSSVRINFAIDGNNPFLATIFPSSSIFHHRVDAASTSLPIDTSPAAAIYSGYQSATVKAFFGSDGPFPNGIPAIEVPSNQPHV